MLAPGEGWEGSFPGPQLPPQLSLTQPKRKGPHSPALRSRHHASGTQTHYLLLSELPGRILRGQLLKNTESLEKVDVYWFRSSNTEYHTTSASTQQSVHPSIHPLTH